MPRVTKKGVEETLLFLKEKHWEMVRRNPGYRTDYEYLMDLRKRTSSGKMQENWRLTAEMHHKYQLFDFPPPNCRFTKKIAKLVAIGEGYLKFPERSLLEPIHSCSFKVGCDSDMEGKPGSMKNTRKRALVYGMYLQILVNIDLEDSYIQELCLKAVRLARECLDDDQKRPRNQKRETFRNAIKAFDLKKSGKSLPEIGKLLELGKDPDAAADKAAKLCGWAQDEIESIG